MRDIGQPPVLAVDVMGSDRGPGEILEGVRRALNTRTTVPFRVILVGDGETIRSAIGERGFRSVVRRVEIFHAAEVIGMEESPTKALRQKKHASMAQAVELVKEGRADGALSCGNTGALVALGTIRLRPMEGLDRPTLATVIPAIDRHFVLLDVGANPAPTARQMVHSAILGSHYSSVALRTPSPQIGLLSIGTEEGKGNGLVQEVHETLKLLASKQIINYRGLIEGFQLFQAPADGSSVDVVVCDGFVGNVLLKAMESIAKRLKTFLRKELMRNPFRAFGCLFLGGALRNIRMKLNAERYGAAPLLGLKGSIFKAHGASNCREICHAVLIAQRFLRAGMDEELHRQVLQAQELLRSAEERPPENF
ncbi:MAG: phosphate acyltransferase PlsX [Puniceicoccales bacterium]|jgi:glycerol-3-phosphate acyltransferase PlsX|nr:phosphate acyltransferase PlsX [Puniceicoccales bacterium]